MAALMVIGEWQGGDDDRRLTRDCLERWRGFSPARRRDG
jgi:hypothetical protein